MEKLIARLAKIKDKIAALRLQQQKLAQELKKAESTNQRLRQLIEIQNNTIKQQEQQLKIKRIADQLEAQHELPPNESRALKSKINEIIREVDKVIATLHQ